VGRRRRHLLIRLRQKNTCELQVGSAQVIHIQFVVPRDLRLVNCALDEITQHVEHFRTEFNCMPYARELIRERFNKLSSIKGFADLLRCPSPQCLQLELLVRFRTSYASSAKGSREKNRFLFMNRRNSSYTSMESGVKITSGGMPSHVYR